MKRRHFIKHALAGAALAAAGRSLRGESSEPALGPNKALEVAGTKAASPTFYRRMFPGLRPKYSRSRPDIEKGLKDLGGAMVDRDPEIDPENQPQLPLAGYTYLGQFIDHDLTLDLTSLESVTNKVEETQNFRTPFLDLDQLYGGGPNLSPFLYEKGNRNAERFLIGKTIESSGLKASDDDLPRNVQGIALVGDPRQDENLILAQLHVAFLKLHNRVIAQPKELDPYRRKGESDFAAAQRVVRWHYQWMARYDYLKKILDSTVFDSLDELEKEKRADGHLDPRIPVEFSAAAFRFGHSMVRDVYKTGVNNRHKDKVRLHEFFQQTGITGGANPALLAEWVVCWNRFFEIPPLTSLLNRARKIDTQIANELHHLDERTIKPFNAFVPGERPEPHLPVRTLVRGSRMDLPSGESVAQEVAGGKPGIRILTSDELIDGPHKEILTNPTYGFRDNTPLWYYVLKEAEVLNSGIHLGPVGSYIVANVIIGALAADRDSYFWGSDYPKWEPPFGTSMGQLLRFIFPANSIRPRCKPID